MIATRVWWLALAIAFSGGCSLSLNRLASERTAMLTNIQATIRSASPSADNADLARTLRAMSDVDRDGFVPVPLRRQAYAERPLPIGHDQTISDPYIVAVMTAAARIQRGANVLDVGTGSGYQAAVLSRIAQRVSSIEIVAPLAKEAARRLSALGYRNVSVRAGDGFAGWPERAPFDAIVVTAGAAGVPQPLLDQLKPGGRLVMPIGPSYAQEQILVFSKGVDGTLKRCTLGWSMFVPLTGKGERLPGSRGLLDTTIPLCFEGPVARVDFVPAPSP